MDLHQTRSDLSKDMRKKAITLLNQTLATITDLSMMCKQAHWNVKGMEFIALHKLFDELAEDIERQADIVAERITALGGTAHGTIHDAVQNTILEAYPPHIFKAQDHLRALAKNFAVTAHHAREKIAESEKLGDTATSDIYIDLTRLLDKILWFVEAHLQK